ncbi:3-hydroxyanthranilate 3,4-dioxygenase-like isoform X2 [Xenia sp. Carnegie-2017]|uniref:3-hydroxyanthranilate 3,4-dioxygenase-like isoform X2 n=1 Tax=Xenia sp. Carnegie-2017 TaxID=2897299 RepID=UPI001F03A958|nr:3-hydroxyanthranilate 3,4-dioxygenase-like isoform X2 [Xenia sp. Carnegie-2017]
MTFWVVCHTIKLNKFHFFLIMANEPSIKVINTKIWVAENEGSFVPPVCNKLMYGDGQLKIMFVGGPNSRKDFHIEEGEELFYMVKGNMCLKVKEQGKPKDIIIKEGEVFLLPCHIPHSPQRFPNTIGMVIEREREKGEQDCLRYYCEDDTTTLFEKWFYCADLGKDLVPIVKSFFESEQYRTGIPIDGTITDSPPFQLDKTTELASPFLLQKWVDENKDEIREKGYKVMFQTKQTMIFHRLEFMVKEIMQQMGILKHGSGK